MRPAFLIAAVATLLGCAKTLPSATPAKAQAEHAQELPPAPKAPVAPVPLEEYFKIRRIGGGFATPSFSFDEKLLAFSSDAGGRVDVWIAPVAGGDPRPVTRVEGFLHSIAFSPTADVLLYEADRGGDELPHLFLTNSRGEAPKDLCASDPKTARTQFIEWADDGKSFLYLSNRRDEKYLDLYEYALVTGRSELLWKSSGKVAFSLASRNHRRFVTLETLSDVDTNLYLVERGSKRPAALLTPHRQDVLYFPTAISKDARTLYFTSDQAGEFAALYSMDLGDRKIKPVLAQKWDVERGEFSRGFRYFITQTNVQGTPTVVLTDTATGKPVELPSAGADLTLVPLATSKSDRYVAAEVVSDVAPRNLAVVDLKAKTVSQPVDPLPPTLQGRPMVPGKLVRIPSFDGKEVPAFLYSPAGPGPFPAVIDVHGGPTYQSKREFSTIRQYLVSKGIAVLVPNVRGSTGYGKTYTKADNLDLGGGPLKDIVACKAWLAANAQVDPSRVVVMGGSYGGYMALAAATLTPDEFAANVDYFGVSDLKTLVESLPPYWASWATFIYQKFGDPKNPAHAQYQHDRSPVHFVDRVNRPLLVVQGENDARVKKDQSERIVAKLRERNVPVHYLLLPGEGHGFSNNENRLATYQVTDRFLDRYLFGDPSVQVLPP
jgi:dipeptidyl aminopeptidase/acylaminoacyl peptidase